MNSGMSASSDELEDVMEESQSQAGISAKEEEKLEVAKRENRWVFWLRFLTTAVLLCVAIGVCVAVYVQGRQSETDDFEQDFSDLGEKLVISFADVVHQRFGAVESFALDLTSAANGSWPFFTPRDYHRRVLSLVKLSQMAMVIMIPKVTGDNLQDYNAYTSANNGWKAEGMADYYGMPVEEVNARPSPPVVMCFHCGGPPKPQDGPGPFYPTWVSAPTSNSSTYNIDMGGDAEHLIPIESTIEKGKPAFEMSYDYWDPEAEKDLRFEMLSQIPHFDYQNDPFTIAHFPIFDSFGEDRKVPAIFMTMIYWRPYFNGLLPPGSNGIVVILENDCNQTYTYQVDGLTSRFIGHNDLHDPKYDYLGTGTSIAELMGDDTESVAGKNTDCQYSIRVYPSQEFEDAYHTNKPWVYAVVLAALFLFTSAIFLFYDFMVEQRQKKVMKSALESGKLVSDLFPKEVRDRLYEEQQNNAKTQESRAGWENNQAVEQAIEHKEAIASLYPETTIFFADLAGFTKWSSTRTPVEVFQLLEALYGAFDKIADRRRVFKVETIGDCYVAATGLPNPQADHAVTMCKFANDCMAKMNVMIASLSDSLGEDTTELAMRVGLHSGPVTAGVLRGQKSRFQLFGDTVNTASRMESNGVKGRIHVSQATADALIARGKGTWLTEREDRIVAKGKGEMVTYFVDVRQNAKSTTSFLSESTCSPLPQQHDVIADEDKNGGSGTIQTTKRTVKDQNGAWWKIHIGWLRQYSQLLDDQSSREEGPCPTLSDDSMAIGDCVAPFLIMS